MGLTDVFLKSVFNTSEDDVIADFFVPALSNSIKYDRGVGYFSAGWLQMASTGMLEFATRRGKARWITSPILSEEDWKALQLGEDAKSDDTIKKALAENIKDLAYALSEETLSALAWLIADGIIEFRLAIPRNKLKHGEFHDKFGIFVDENNDVISFSGSNNESIQGTINYESFKVFTSWNQILQSFVEQDIKRFETLWNNKDPNVEVYSLPEAAKAQILKLRTQKRPYLNPQKIRLWEHQQDAVNAWEANHRLGIMSMATGSGKTLTSLIAASQINNLKMLIIAVPRSNLVNQWAEELNSLELFPQPILVFSSRNNWQDKLFNRLLSMKSHTSDSQTIVIGTMASLSGDAFATVVDDTGLPDKTLMIVDEVHNVGSPRYRRILRDDVLWRLGLSATPTRHFDEVGTNMIDEYFGGVVFSYGLAEALEEGRLTPYDYDIYPVYMSEEEYSYYRNLTSRIIAIRGKRSSEVTYLTNNTIDDDSKDVEKLLFERARIIKKCAEKDDKILNILQDYPPSRCLVYCADKEQLSSVSNLLNEKQVIHLTYTSDHSNNQRKQSLDTLAHGHISLLLAIDCLDEGVDVPVVDQAIILASSSNMRQFIQRRGRVLRRAKGKIKANLIDVIVLPPSSVGADGKHILYGELARAREMASLAQNSINVMNKIADIIRPYGILFSEFIAGERYE